MKIISLRAENIKRLTAVNITPKGNVVKVTGKNGNGKSSVLDSIMMALGGGDTIPGKPIHEGADKGLIELDLGELKVTRRFTEKGSTLTVESKDGAQFRGPQGILDKMIGKLSFDPMAFMRLKPVEQFRNLAEHSGIDFTKIDTDRKAAFDERTVVNRTGKAKAAEVDAMALVLDPDAADEVVSSGDLISQINDANKSNTVVENHKNELELLLVRENDLTSAIHECNETLARLSVDLTELVDVDISALKNTIAADVLIDVDPLQEKLTNLEDDNNAARAKQNHAKENDALIELRAESQELTDTIEQLDIDRTDLIKKAKLPIKGLSFGDESVTFNDIPLNQASSSEQIKVSVSVAMAMNPKLKVIRIQDGSLLDSDTMAIIEKMAKNGDFQFWVEQVDESGKIGVVIEDGAVASDNQ